MWSRLKDPSLPVFKIGFSEIRISSRNCWAHTASFPSHAAIYSVSVMDNDTMSWRRPTGWSPNVKSTPV